MKRSIQVPVVYTCVHAMKIEIVGDANKIVQASSMHAHSSIIKYITIHMPMYVLMSASIPYMAHCIYLREKGVVSLCKTACQLDFI